jgi:putative ABC transport system ATP-binding protein
MRTRQRNQEPTPDGSPPAPEAGDRRAPAATAVPAPDLLQARAVRKSYRSSGTETLALAGVDLTVRAGDFVAVMGPSGCGKTTLLNCLSGLDDIDEGDVFVQGNDIFGMSDKDRTAHRARSMGFVFQAFNLIPVFSAAENVELPLLLTGTGPKESRRRAVDMLGRVGLGHRTDHRPNELSGGEQQRVTIARALVAGPALVWADEPTGALDTHMAAQVVDLLCRLNEEDGQTIVLVTHDSGVGAAATRMVRMRDGSLVSDEVQPRPAVPDTVPGTWTQDR